MRMRPSAVTICLMASAAPWILPSTVGAVESDAPNILVVLVDALRADRLGAYGHRGHLTPAIDTFAREGVVFERAIAAAPWTLPSVASLFTSVYPSVHGVFGAERDATGPNPDRGWEGFVLADAFDTLAERLQRAGYQTAAFSANPLVVRKNGFDQGFEYFTSRFSGNETPAHLVNRALLDWLDAERDASRPFFIYTHYMDVHGPYNAEPRFLEPLIAAVERQADKQRITPQERESLGYLLDQANTYGQPGRHEPLFDFREYWIARYEAGVRQFDFYFAELRDSLRARGLWGDLYVVFLSDHGESLCEHGYWDHGWGVSHADLHVPLVCRWPGRIPAGRRVRERVRLIDVPPTVLNQLALPAPAGAQGRSLVGRIDGTDATPSPPAFAEGVKGGAEQKACYTEGWKLVFEVSRPPRHWLYRIIDDPYEQVDHAAERPPIAEALYKDLRQQLAENRRRRAKLETDVAAQPPSRDEIERLRALGYLLDESGNAAPAPTSLPAALPQRR
jgi:arylsulfatase A-like enzyme